MDDNSENSPDIAGPSAPAPDSPIVDAAPTEPALPADSTASTTSTTSITWFRDGVTIGGAVALVVALLFMPFHQYLLFGLPAHVLLVHIPVILIPVLCVATVVIIWHPTWRRRYGVTLLVVAVVALVATFVAAGAGETLRAHLFPARRLGNPLAGMGLPKRSIQQSTEQNVISSHAQAGSRLRLVMWLFAASILAVVTFDRARGRETETGTKENLPSRQRATIAINVVVTLLAALSLGWVIYTGHLGTKAVWGDRVGNGVIQQQQPGGLQQPGGFGRFPGGNGNGNGQYRYQPGGSSGQSGAPNSQTSPANPT